MSGHADTVSPAPAGSTNRAAATPPVICGPCTGHSQRLALSCHRNDRSHARCPVADDGTTIARKHFGVAASMSHRRGIYSVHPSKSELGRHDVEQHVPIPHTTTTGIAA